MAKKRHTAEQVIAKLREAEVLLAKGTEMPMVCRRLGVTQQTYYRWRGGHRTVTSKHESEKGMKQPKTTGRDELWDRGWDEHQSRQLRRQASLPFAENLKWLEEAQEFGENLIAQSKRRKSGEARE